MNAQFKKGILELCVLSLIRRRDYYGYELVEEISKQFEISEGTIYPILRRLTDEKYFETYLRESSSGPPRKYYRLTDEGRAAHAQLLREWNDFDRQVKSLLNGEAT
ncbi:MAG: PadR family transcriptional regulator [Bdellovibrionaceae bacterium]|nr:PadR family transcriptional regulator [Pseudobdellovibrionaceae bacterium]MBX3034394.1 PadR family transcriptional regulator [Pseudobdellovibrionaceae bacterium]